MESTNRNRLILATCGAIFLGALLLMPLVGSQTLDYREVWRFLQGTQTGDGVIFFRIRLPRVLLGLMVGSALAVAGVVFQALLRNPLATPYTLGVSAGGALGALLVIKSGVVFSWWGFSAIQIAAFAGSLLTIGLVYLLARRAYRLSIHAMILAGVTIGYFFSALILILHYIADFTETHQMIRWTIGGLDVVDYDILLQSLPVVIGGFWVLWGMGRTLNIMSTSEEIALSKGVNVNRAQKLAFTVASLLTGTVVALSGPIGFIGLIIPHLLRLLGGPDHRYLIPAAFLLGGGFLTVADTIARTIFAPIDLPVGIITVLVGGPFFLWILVRRP